MPAPNGTAPPRRARLEAAAWAVLVAAALALRLVDLGERAFHHDESQVAYFSWRLFTDHEYAYNPLLHGPWEYYTTALAYAIGGVSDVTARLGPAVMGTVMVALPYGLRRQMGGVAAFTAGAFLAVSPTVLYYSRFLREDVHIATLTLAIIVVAWRLLESPRRWHPVALLALFAATLTVKESAHLFGLVFVTFALGMAVLARERLLHALRAPGARAWAAGAGAFALVFCTLYSSFFTHLPGIWDGIYEGPAYWLGQHEVGRGDEPWFFYLLVIGGHEWPVVLLGLAGIAAVLRRPAAVPLFLVWAFALQLALYSYLGEKFAWLALHPLIPLVLLAGLGAQALRRASRPAFAVAAAVAAAGLAHSSYLVNADGPVHPRELLVSTQSATDTRIVAAEIAAFDDRLRRERGRPATIVVDPHEGASFPWAWYLRDRSVSYDAGVRTPGYEPRADVLLLTDASRERLGPALRGYEGRRFRFRVWWVRDFGTDSVGRWVDWLVRRRTWNPTGGMPEWVYFRRET